MKFGFFGLGLALFNLGFNLYIASWLIRRLRPGPWGRFLIIEGALLLSAFYTAARALPHSYHGPFLDNMLWLAYFCFGASFILSWSLGLCDLALAGLRKYGLGGGRALPAICLVFAAGLVAFAGWKGAETPKVKRLEIPVKGLPAALDGFSIIQISDTHLGRLTGLPRLEKIAAAVEAARPDLIAFTGDFTEGREPMPEGVCEALKGMKPRLGKIAVLGNHDLFAGEKSAASFFEACAAKSTSRFPAWRWPAWTTCAARTSAGRKRLRQSSTAPSRWFFFHTSRRASML